MFGQMKQGIALPMDEVMTHLRGLQWCKYPAMVIDPSGGITIKDVLGKPSDKIEYRDAQEFLTAIRKKQ